MSYLYTLIDSMTLQCKNNLRVKIYSMHIISAVRCWVLATWLGLYFNIGEQHENTCSFHIVIFFRESTSVQTSRPCRRRFTTNRANRVESLTIWYPSYSFAYRESTSIQTNRLESWSTSDESTLSLLSLFKNEEGSYDHFLMGLRVTWCASIPWESSRVVVEGSCIIISLGLTSGRADRLRANRVESSSTSDESTQFGCIGHGWVIKQKT